MSQRVDESTSDESMTNGCVHVDLRNYFTKIGHSHGVFVQPDSVPADLPNNNSRRTVDICPCDEVGIGGLYLYLYEPIPVISHYERVSK